jgi:hypothetical protein
VRSAYARAAAQQRDFELRLAYAGRGPGSGGAPNGGGARAPRSSNGSGGGGSGGSGGPPRRVGSLHFRFAQHAGVDGSTPLIGIPNFLPSTGAPPAFYFATLREAGPAPPPLRPSLERARLLAASGGGGSGSALGSAGTIAEAVSGSGAGACYRMLEDEGAYADIRLGPLLGRGSFGRVYRGAAPAGAQAGAGCAKSRGAPVCPRRHAPRPRPGTPTPPCL